MTALPLFPIRKAVIKNFMWRRYGTPKTGAILENVVVDSNTLIMTPHSLKTLGSDQFLTY